MKKMFMVLSLILLGAILVGCNKDTKKVAALVIHRQDDDFSQTVAKAFEEEVKNHEGWEFELQNPNGDIEMQISMIEQLITKGTSGFAILPLDNDAVAPAAKRAVGKGIAVFGLATIPGINGDVQSEHGNGGAQAAEALVEALDGKGKIAIVDITAVMPGVKERVDAFKKVIAKYPDIEIVSEQKCMTTDEAITVAESIYTAHPDLDGIFGSFANAVIGSARAAKNMNKNDVIVVGIDGDKEIIRLIDEGWIYASSTQDPVTIGKLAAQYVIGIAEGTKELKVVKVQHKLIDRKNYKEMWKELYGTDFS